MAKTEYTKEQLEAIEEMAKVQVRTAATNNDDEGMTKFGDVLFTTRRMVAEADAPKKPRQPRGSRHVAQEAGAQTGGVAEAADAQAVQSADAQPVERTGRNRNRGGE